MTHSGHKPVGGSRDREPISNPLSHGDSTGHAQKKTKFARLALPRLNPLDARVRVCIWLCKQWSRDIVLAYTSGPTASIATMLAAA